MTNPVVNIVLPNSYKSELLLDPPDLFTYFLSAGARKSNLDRHHGSISSSAEWPLCEA